MRVLVLSRPKFQVPPEQLRYFVEHFAEWRAKYRDKMESFEFFAGGGGGFGIATVEDETELNRIMLEWPFYGYAELEIHPLISGDIAIKQWQEALQAYAVPA